MTMNRKGRYLIASLILFALLFWLLFRSSNQVPDIKYRVIDIDGQDGVRSYPVEINNKGEVIGWSLDTRMRGYFWSAKTGKVYIGAASPDFEIRPISISEKGVVLVHFIKHLTAVRLKVE